MKRLALASIVFDAGTQVRAQINEDVVAEYAERMTEGDIFPPVIVFHDGDRHYMADGFHRGRAAERIGRMEIDAEVRSGTKTEALWYALGAFRESSKASLRPTVQDKRHAILLALREWYFGRDTGAKSTNEIARQVGVDGGYVREVAERESQVVDSHNLPARVTGKDGKSYPARRTPKPASESTPTPPKTNGNGGLDKSRAAVQERRRRMREMAEAGHTSAQIAASLGIGETGCRVTLRNEGIDVPADRAVGKSRHHDSNRIVEAIVIDAENLTAGVGLVEFDALDGARLGDWIKSLTEARAKLSTFIRQLTQEAAKR